MKTVGVTNPKKSLKRLPQNQWRNQMKNKAFGGKETKAEERAEAKSGKKGMKAGGLPTADKMGNMGMEKGGRVKKYAAGGTIKPAPTKDNGTPTAKEQAEMRKVRDEQRTYKAENDAYNKASGMKFAKGGPIKGDKDMQALDKTIQANKLKDYMGSEAKLREQRDAAGTKKFARGGGIEKKGKTRGRIF